MDQVKFPVINDKNLSEIRKKYLPIIKNDLYCREFILDNGISDEEILNKTSKFIRVIEDGRLCKDCQGFSNCKKKMSGLILGLKIDEETRNIDLEYRKCIYAKSLQDANSYFLVRDFPDLNLQYDFDDLKNNIDYINSRINALNTLTKIIKKTVNYGIFLHGSRQCGKTFILSLFAKKYAEKHNAKVAFINASSEFKYLNDLFFDSKDDFYSKLNALANVDLLIIDDFGNEFKNEYIRDIIVFPLLDERLKNRKLTCFSSNYIIDEIESMYSIKERFSPKARQLKEIISLLSKYIVISSLPFRE